jgi:thermitase
VGTLRFTIPLLLAACAFSISIGSLESQAIGVEAKQPQTNTAGIISPTSDRYPATVRMDGVQPAGDYGYADPSTLYFNSLEPNDPYYSDQWALRKIDTPYPPSGFSREGQVILVAVLDTGIDRDQEDLKGQVFDETDLTLSGSASDINGHGTHIAGIIAAISNNSRGIAGISPGSKLLNVKVAEDNGQCRVSTVVEGIRWAADHGAKVINLSLEIRSSSRDLEEAINYAWDKGAVIVASGSNETAEEPVYPAYYHNCISVVATRQNDTIGPLANYPAWVDVAAPGFNIFSTLPGNSYGYKSGTSFATAYVSGLAAFLMPMAADSNYDGKVNDEVRESIEKGAVTINTNTFKLINAMNSMNFVIQDSSLFSSN